MNGLPHDESSHEQAVRPGDHVVLRKPHPCGSLKWEVTRIGADIGLKCLGCNGTVMLPRHEFRAKLVRIMHVPESPH